jgi:hypothetical protein
MTPNLAQIAAANEERKRVRAAATAGIWLNHGDDFFHTITAKFADYQTKRIVSGEFDPKQFGRIGGHLDFYNAEFIAYAANDTAASTIDELLAEVKRVNEELERLKSISSKEG